MEAELSKYLNLSMKFALSDGRVIIGKLKCTDSNCNIVVSDSIEYGVDAASADGLQLRRRLGLAMIPGKHILSAALQESDLSVLKFVDGVS